ncbi:aspartate kinase [Halobacillus alkaliphilus]|uniref:Aspartokinase n=1 Tax=Halobacillus alkaliphilus TaxID=396056 RepID=A0A1I2PJ70_9BACI|nr:aspartate kinase [Halobacillus alkaliphilus]SFG15620.1 aspartate kinase [Halobacillus alkaliphilus]
MARVVQKYGGTSLQTTERIRLIADRVIRDQEQSSELVIVVSAMGESTNQLVKLSGEVSSCTSGRETDLLLSAGEQISSALLALAIQERGREAVALTGVQAGIETEDIHGDARITAVHTAKIEKELDAGKIVVVAGFQGCAGNQEICTLGRGGSDTTAAALAAELRADRCEIFTDVDGVYSADPRYISGAKKHTSLDYNHLLTLADLGAEVVHPRAVVHAKEHQIPLVVRSSFHDQEGTNIQHYDRAASPVVGVTFQNGFSRIQVSGEIEEKEILEGLTDAGGLLGKVQLSQRHASIMIKDEYVQEISLLLNKRRNAFGIHSIHHTEGMAAVHVVFGSRDEKRRLAPLLNEKQLVSSGDVYALECHPLVWSAVVPEEHAVGAAQELHDWFMEMESKKASIAL